MQIVACSQRVILHLLHGNRSIPIPRLPMVPGSSRTRTLSISPPAFTALRLLDGQPIPPRVNRGRRGTHERKKPLTSYHGRVHGVQPVPAGANEIPAARTFIERCPSEGPAQAPG